MAQIVFDENKVTLGDLVQSEKGRTPTQTAQLLAKFVQTDDGLPVEAQDAFDFILSLSVPEGRAAMTAFWKFMGGVKDNAVNPPTPPGS